MKKNEDQMLEEEDLLTIIGWNMAELNLERMPNKRRLEIFSKYCIHCGKKLKEEN